MVNNMVNEKVEEETKRINEELQQIDSNTRQIEENIKKYGSYWTPLNYQLKKYYFQFDSATHYPILEQILIEYPELIHSPIMTANAHAIIPFTSADDDCELDAVYNYYAFYQLSHLACGNYLIIEFDESDGWSMKFLKEQPIGKFVDKEDKNGE